MADPLAPDNPLTAALDTRVPKIVTVVDEARQRVRERAQEAVRRQNGGPVPSAPSAPSARSASSAVPRVTALPIPEQAKDGPVSIRLRNGRRLRAVLSPGVARRSDLAAIARANADNNRRAFGALQTHGAAIDSLERSHEELAAKIAQLEKRADEAVLAVTDTFTQSTRHLKQLAAQGQKVLARAGTAATAAAGQLQQVQALAVTQQTQNLTNVIGTAQATAYGERGSVLAPNNVLLTGNQLFWTFLAPLSTVFGASAGTALLLGALAPLGSLVTGFAAVGSRLPARKQQRFITGISTFDGRTRIVREPLRDRFTDDDFFVKKFRDRDDVPVTVTLAQPPAEVGTTVPFTARVLVGGILEIALLTEGLVATRVAWIVDTGAEEDG